MKLRHNTTYLIHVHLPVIVTTSYHNPYVTRSHVDEIALSKFSTSVTMHAFTRSSTNEVHPRASGCRTNGVSREAFRSPQLLRFRSRAKADLVEKACVTCVPFRILGTVEVIE